MKLDPVLAQVALALLLLATAVAMVILGETTLATALVGAAVGQGAGQAVRSATNGNGGGK